MAEVEELLDPIQSRSKRSPSSGPGYENNGFLVRDADRRLCLDVKPSQRRFRLVPNHEFQVCRNVFAFGQEFPLPRSEKPQYSFDLSMALPYFAWLDLVDVRNLSLLREGFPDP